MKKAFTLVELLVVVAILGILMAVLIGTFGGAGESARATKCMANLHSLGMAAHSYAMENGSFPGNWISTTGDGKEKSYISPYANNIEQREFALTNGAMWRAINKSRESYYCPAHQRYAREHGLGNEPLWSYVMNKSLCGSGNAALERGDRQLLFAELPFAKVQNADFQQSGAISGDELDPILEPALENGEGGNEVIGFNHKNGKTLCAHICYADAHVGKLLAPKKGDVLDLTTWLCNPTDKKQGDFDITFDGSVYQKSIDSE